MGFHAQAGEFKVLGADARIESAVTPVLAHGLRKGLFNVARGQGCLRVEIADKMLFSELSTLRCAGPRMDRDVLGGVTISTKS